MQITLLNDRLIELSDTLRACLGSCLLAQSVHGVKKRLRYFSISVDHKLLRCKEICMSMRLACPQTSLWTLSIIFLSSDQGRE